MKKSSKGQLLRCAAALLICGGMVCDFPVAAADRPILRDKPFQATSPDSPNIRRSDEPWPHDRGNRAGRPEVKVNFPEIHDWNSLRITLERGPCLGRCPFYKVVISGDGSVAFEGNTGSGIRLKWVPYTREGKVRKAVVEDLFRKFKEADFFWLYDNYRASVTDGPTYEVTISFDGQTKYVSDYLGNMMGMPEIVGELEAAIDTAANTKQWLEPPK